MLNDPDMNEIVESFCLESRELTEKLEALLDDYEQNQTKVALLEEFGQVIDRIMGAAKSIGADKVGHYCELGKIISYKASQSDDHKLLEIVTAVLFDTLDILNDLIENIKVKRNEELDGMNTDAIAKRLLWLEEKFSHIQRASVSVHSHGKQESQDSVDELLKKLGI